LNVVRDRRNWMPFFSWLTVAVLAVPFTLFFTHFLTWGNFVIAFVYSMVILGTHGTVWYHRYSTHRAYRFSHPFWRFLVRNAVVKVIPEEIYVVSHHVHHAISEKPGDPYNVHGGWLYCFLADAIHQPIARSMSKTQYGAAVAMVEHAGVKPNTYAQYLRWGSIAHPLRTVVHFALNWAFWYGAFYLLGGHSLAVTIFASCGVWAIGVRTFNYDGHGGGKDKRRDGIDFNREDLSINQLWPGLVTGEWHNNHHLYPTGARAGFLRYQLDYAWWVIRGLYALGGIASYRDFTEEFHEKYYRPYLETKAKDRDAGDRPSSMSCSEQPRPHAITRRARRRA
jgi:stearoyl-CoA desaturase (delta-9 desaturase)